eukprot:1215271-Pyramimonas_sp.AAC.1
MLAIITFIRATGGERKVQYRERRGSLRRNAQPAPRHARRCDGDELCVRRRDGQGSEERVREASGEGG